MHMVVLLLLIFAKNSNIQNILIRNIMHVIILKGKMTSILISFIFSLHCLFIHPFIETLEILDLL